MSDSRGHSAYDEVAAELGAAARRLMAPALMAAVQRGRTSRGTTPRTKLGDVVAGLLTEGEASD